MLNETVVLCNCGVICNYATFPNWSGLLHRMRSLRILTWHAHVLFPVFRQHWEPTRQFAHYTVRASIPALVQVCMAVCVRAVDSSWWTQQIKDDSGVYHWAAYSSSIGGWCVILNNWVTSVQTLSLGVMPNICAWSAPSLRQHSLAQICSLWRGGGAVVETSQCVCTDAFSLEAPSVIEQLHPENISL